MRNREIRPAVSIAGAVMALVSAAVILPAYAARGDEPPPGASDDPVLVGAGDIARCSSLGGPMATASLLDKIPGTVFTAGDNSQDSGLYSQYVNCFGPTWGRLKDRIRPAPGNHDSMTTGAAGYYRYFGAAAGEPGKGYYSYDLGNWHVVVLNSNCFDVGGCDAGSAQERWLRADLAANSKPCTAAYWHHPLFTSSVHGDGVQVRPLFGALYDFGAEIVMNGHNHVYERFMPVDPDGVPDPNFGIREFTVGTGGASHYSFSYFPDQASEVRNNSAFGVLKLTLRESSYDWEFVPIEGARFTDSGSGKCHTPKPPVSPTVSPPASPSVSSSPAESPSPSVSASQPVTPSGVGSPSASPSPPDSASPSASPSQSTWPWWPTSVLDPAPTPAPTSSQTPAPTSDWPWWRPTTPALVSPVG